MSSSKTNFEAIFHRWQLSDIEIRITKLILNEITEVEEIAIKLNLSVPAAEKHLERIYQKSDCEDIYNVIVKTIFTSY